MVIHRLADKTISRALRSRRFSVICLMGVPDPDVFKKQIAREPGVRVTFYATTDLLAVKASLDYLIFSKTDRANNL